MTVIAIQPTSPLPSPTTTAIGDAVADHLDDLALRGYSSATIRIRSYHLSELTRFFSELSVASMEEVTPALVASYQRHLFAHRKVNGAPLSFRTQAQRLVTAKVFFSWAQASGIVGFDPAASIVLPKTERRLPEATLTHAEAQAVLSQPDTSTALGVRDRAILEVFYSTAIRRGELIALATYDVDHARETLFIRQGKGGRDRHVPIGASALGWIRAYGDEVRPRLVGVRPIDNLFVSSNGTRLCADWLSKTVAGYIAAAVPTKRGSCHLFRHSAATLMLEGGADIRYVGEMLGHAKLETTQVYTRVSIDKLRQVHRATHPGAH